MSQLKRRDSHPVSLFQREMNQLFDDFFQRPFPQVLREGAFSGDWSPTVSVSETDKSIKVQAELPGLERDEIEIHLENDVLQLKGHKKFEKTEDKENVHYSERSYGEFLRRIKLPSAVDAEKASAQLKDGVLKLEIPKTTPNNARKISIGKS